MKVCLMAIYPLGVYGPKFHEKNPAGPEPSNAAGRFLHDSVGRQP